VKILIVARTFPRIELANQAATNNNAAIPPQRHPRAPYKYGPGGYAPNNPAVYICRGVSRIHTAAMRAQRNCVTVRIHLFVVEIVVPLRIRSELWIVFVRSEYEWGSASPTSN
jgi:hypothetical protein